MKSIEVHYMLVNGAPCRLYWCETGGIESFLHGLNRVTYKTNDSYFDLETIEEWLTGFIIEDHRSTAYIEDDQNNVVITVTRLDVERYYKEEV